MDSTQHYHGDTHHVGLLRLLILSGDRPIEVSRPSVVVGRHTDADVRLAYPDVSRRHCRLVFADGVWQVQDLDSLNGVFVNGERMHEATLYAGDQLKIGTATLVVTEAPECAGAPHAMLRSISDQLGAPLAG
jgi:pSer/pThr/pTyr-binding forkhead associated (FHA) protein